MKLWNFNDNKYIYGQHTMELVTNENDGITAYRILVSPDFQYGTFVHLVSNQLV